MVKNEYVSTLRQDILGGIFFLQNFDYFLSAVGKNFRAHRFGRVPDKKSRREKYHEAY
jgi:hypothetical protein